MVQILRQERADDQPRPVVHPAGPRQLAHPRVDDRVASLAALPGAQVLGVLCPFELPHPRLELLLDVRWPVQKDVSVEVTPAQLPDPGRGTRTRMPGCPSLEFEW